MGRLDPRQFKLKDGRIVLIRNGTDRDAAQLIELISSVIREGSFMITMPHEFKVGIREEREWIGSHLVHPGRLLIIAEIEDELVGMLDFHNGPRQRISHRGMLGMNVKRDWRRLG